MKGTQTQGKRSFTVPILLIILTIMAILLVLAYSKLLLTQQEQSIREGKRLSEQYQMAGGFADLLQEGAAMLLQEDSPEARRGAAWLLGEAQGMKDKALAIMVEASTRSGESSPAASPEQLQSAMSSLFGDPDGFLNRLIKQDESVTAEQAGILQAVSDGAADMNEALARFRSPSVDAGYRSMAAGADWVDPAVAASHAFLDMAAKVD